MIEMNFQSPKFIFGYSSSKPRLMCWAGAAEGGSRWVVSIRVVAVVVDDAWEAGMSPLLTVVVGAAVVVAAASECWHVVWADVVRS